MKTVTLSLDNINTGRLFCKSIIKEKPKTLPGMDSILPPSEGGKAGVNYGVGAYGMEWVHISQPEQSRITSQ